MQSKRKVQEGVGKILHFQCKTDFWTAENAEGYSSLAAFLIAEQWNYHQLRCHDSNLTLFILGKEISNIFIKKF